jgi:hypothetical protein
MMQLGRVAAALDHQHAQRKTALKLPAHL